MRTRVRSLLNATVAGFPVLDLGAAVILSACAAALASGTLSNEDPHGGVGASIAVLAMTLPVAWCRRAPVAAAAALAAGALLNALAFGSLARCGAALPAIFIAAFFVAARTDRRARAGLGLALCAVNVVSQSFSDPRLDSQAFVTAVQLLPVLGMFFVLGRIVHARAAAIESLRARTAELRHQREQTARLTVLADRARVSEELDALLRERIGLIAAAANAGRSAPADVLASIELEGRAVLQQMREIVGSLDETAPSEPPPSLAELPSLVASTPDATFTVEGEPRRLPAGIELAGYRIAEHLATALAVLDVRMRFAPDAFELRVSGPPAGDADLGAAIAAARERAAAHDGTLDDGRTNGIYHAVARLPLVTGRA
jgi:hypothetical protein